MIRQSPGVRRLCVCVAAPHSGLLYSACRSGGVGGLYTEHIQPEGIDMGFASPGVDEALLVSDLIAALHDAVGATGVSAAPHCPALAAFHVGITRVEGEDLRGTAVVRIRELLQDLTLASSETIKRVQLRVGISATLFDDIGTECGFIDGWLPLAGANAWFRGYEAPPLRPQKGPASWHLEERI